MATYRRREDEDIWHWCWNCSDWPRTDFEERHARPESGELCTECERRQKEGKCRK